MDHGAAAVTGFGHHGAGTDADSLDLALMGWGVGLCSHRVGSGPAMSEQLVTAIIAGLVGILFGGAGNNFLGLRPLQREVSDLRSDMGERLATLEATVEAMMKRDRRHYPDIEER